MSVQHRPDPKTPTPAAPPPEHRRVVALVAFALLTAPASAGAQAPPAPADPAVAPAPAPGPYVAPAPVPAAPVPAAPVPAPYPPSPGPYPPSPGPYPPSPGPYPPSPGPYPPPPAPGVQPAPPYGVAVVEPPPPETPWPAAPEREYRHHRLTLQTESVFSADEGPFYNHLLGGRYAYHLTRATSLGAYAGYANLKGTGERVHSALFMGQFEYQLFVGDSERVILPLRVGLGYLVENGPMVRFATGVYFVATDDIELGMNLIAPSYWNASNDTVVSMSVSAEVSYAF